ncbi:glutamine--fructose-6-phosphate transaminase (isomerizing) [Acidiphilium acidophilum]|uniref:Glutamine--fructose-6-phosphate aminotransferase [isomerizing] n=1 Tax=Acidiphilium acidophilum TaxID=76588 RepID=A0AAW9DTE8_ACIAO|nr:glutamine--fructose-6-phosphate transaminase (isomerizing) [Acidiphilium acidophilum]MDX5931317.1 glutamine--fructose-6-phosphate transaminase (isomerizing) [Acidiphilium acidophilum]
MCGIVGVVGKGPAAPLLLDGLSRLAYRGYDSAGIATLVDGQIERRRAEGKLHNLATTLASFPLDGTTGISHTRWATHGAPTESNAHPHGTSRVAVVHNGIIENHAALREELESQGQVFSTETDTETVAQLLDLYLARGMSPVEAAASAFQRLEGAYALALIFAGHPDLIIGAQRGAPLAIGYGEDEMYLGSDALALAPLTRRIAYLNDGDWVIVSRTGATFHNAMNQAVEREIKLTKLTGAAIGKGNFRHFMEKELHEHPIVIGDTLHRMIDPATRLPVLPALDLDLNTISRICISACGSAFYAGLTARYWIEEYARIAVDADVASEFRYREPPLHSDELGIVVSQSGETADTMAALRYIRTQGCKVMSVVNVPESTMARESDLILETIAGPEISVASTKAFTAQLTVLAGFALALAHARGTLSRDRIEALVAALMELPAKAAQILNEEDEIRRLATQIQDARDVLFFGRGSMMPIALEGALKLKELSYIHAEGYPAGEMKHGPIALIDASVPVIAVVPSGPLFEKTASNLQEAAARGGRIIVLSDSEGAKKLAGIASEVVILPDCDPFVAPILYAIPVQMLAYQVAILKGTDVDQPRNLAKSVTVE